MSLTINSIDFSGSIVDGPGLRTVLYVQGCEKRCYGCHNSVTWDYSKGTEIQINLIIEELVNKCKNKKLTISGGEPLLQYENILILVKRLKNFNLVLYTGYELKDVPKEILKYLNYIKVGRFIENEKSTTIPYIGSRNQRFIDLKKVEG